MAKAEPWRRPSVPLDRLTCLSGDPVRSEVLGPEPGVADERLEREAAEAMDLELEARLAPNGFLTGPLTPEACAAYLQRRAGRTASPSAG
jgi:hypothetical protein